MLRLVNQLHETRDPLGRKQCLLAGICDIVDGSGGSCVVALHDNELRRRTIASTTEYHRPDHDCDDESSTCHDEHRLLDSVLHLPNSTMSATLRVYRVPGHGGLFTPRERAIVDFFHAEVTWVYQADVLLTSPNARSLAPRARQTLEHLLGGMSEKQIASRLRLSPNTVHHYVKSIHRHFGVSRRSELLARWVGK